jgi:hypothetical protein
MITPPLYVLIQAATEGIGDALWASSPGRSILKHPSSAVRVFVGVIVTILLCVGLVLFLAFTAMAWSWITGRI